jgi:hypothetical protein
MLFNILIVILIILVFYNIKCYEKFNSNINTNIPPMVSFKCITPKQLIVDGEHLNYSEANFRKASKFCFDNLDKCKAFTIIDNKFYYSNDILKIPDNYPDKSWVINPEMLYSDINIDKRNIGINIDPDPNYYIDVNGSMVIQTDNDKENIICLEDDKGIECISKKDIYNINKAPIYYKSDEVICLYDDKKKSVCVNGTELGILAGTTKFNLKNVSLTDPNANNYIAPYSFNIPSGEISISNALASDTKKATLNKVYSKGHSVNSYNLNTPDVKSPTNFFIVPPQLSSGEEQKCSADYGSKIEENKKYICKDKLKPECIGYEKNKKWGTCSVPTQKCVANYGSKLNDKICCGQEGKIENEEYICKNPLFPTCSGYKNGIKWGKCIQQECIANYGAKVGSKACCRQNDKVENYNLDYVCKDKNAPDCIGYEKGKYGKCTPTDTILPFFGYKYD